MIIWLRLLIWISGVASLCALASHGAAQDVQTYQEYVRAIEAEWNASNEAREFDEFRQQQDATFQAFARQEQEAYRRYVAEIRRKWNAFRGSSPTEWIEYSDDTNTVSVVNFKDEEEASGGEPKRYERPETPGAAEPEESPEPRPEETPQPEPSPQPDEEPIRDDGPPDEPSAESEPGRIVIETLVAADDPDASETAAQQIAAQLERIVATEDGAGNRVLEGQLRTQSGEDVTPDNVEAFILEEVHNKIEVDPEPIRSENGVERFKMRVKVPLVPNHLRVRAERYLSIVQRHARDNHMTTPLTMSVIQTESYFNPRAVSAAPAYGLMQLVPTSGGRDAYRAVFKKDEAPTPDFLFNPDNNVLLGSVYFRLLKEKYLYGVKDAEKTELLAIAAYNGGIGRVIERVLKKHDVSAISVEELRDVLQRVMPKETAEYLDRVTQRVANYLEWGNT